MSGSVKLTARFARQLDGIGLIRSDFDTLVGWSLIDRQRATFDIKDAHGMKYNNIELHNVCDIVIDDGAQGFRTTRYPLAIHDQINQGANLPR